MSSIKKERATLLLKDLAADFLERHSNRTSLVTVTGVTLSPDQKSARILLSVLPKEKTAAAVDFANRYVDEFRDYLKSRSRLRFIPRITFIVDEGELNRQRIEELGIQLETE